MTGLDWTGRRVVVVGMARSGSAAARLLARHGARVLGTDLREAAALGLDPDAWGGTGIELHLGAYRKEDLLEKDLLVLSPGVPKTAPAVRDALELGLPVLSELEVASTFARAPMAAVTGTNGKSTTVTVLGALIRALDRPVAVAGNVGRALSEAVETVPPDGFLVVEVSSFQLEDIQTFHPRAAAVLNLAPDHLDRYADFDSYIEAKLRIFGRQDASDTAVIPAGDARLEAAVAAFPGRVLRFGGDAVGDGVAAAGGTFRFRDRGRETPLLPLEDLSLPGPHNVENMAAAVCLLAGLGLDPADPRVGETLRTVRGLPHRIEPVGTIDGIPFYNDSKATNPDSLRVALGSFPQPVVLIAGGRAKGGDYGSLSGMVAGRVKALVLLGEAAPLLEEAWRETGVPMLHAGSDLEEAVRLALEAAREGGSPVLLSPGCASFDMFRDYEDRGDRFRALVAGWGGRS